MFIQIVFFMIYDLNFIRTKKLATILNKDVEYPTEVKGECLFIHDCTKNYLWVNTDMWSFIRENYYKHIEISKLIKSWLEENYKCKDLIPHRITLNYIFNNFI